MRLIKVSTVESPAGLLFMDFPPGQIPPYAILSHTWGDDEVTWADIVRGVAASKASFHKIRNTCRLAFEHGLDWAWIDSCCIDKASSAELSEAINSMYLWYQNAEICYAHLSGISSSADVWATNGEFAGCRWFTRGWTLQELLAPSNLIFFSDDWVHMGEKVALSRPLSIITGIDEAILTGEKPLDAASVAKRMSWAAHRETTRPEDVAYCLMGVFGVNMPMLYGEGDKAFVRLQEEIMKISDDQSLFAWVDADASSDASYGLLAKSPRNFAFSNSVLPYQDWEPRPPYHMTNRGLTIDLPMTRREDSGDTVFVAALDCPAPPDYEDKSFLAVYLRKISHRDQQYVRVRANQFAKVYERGIRATIYVKQNFSASANSEGVFPEHILQLRRGPAPVDYAVDKVIVHSAQASNPPQVILKSTVPAREWIPTPNLVALRAPKGAGQLGGAVAFTRPEDGERLLVMLGYAKGLRLGFHAIDLPATQPGEPEEESRQAPDFEDLQRMFDPVLAGGVVQLPYHRVFVDVDTVISHATKYLMVDLHIEKTISSGREGRGRWERAVQAYDMAVGRENKAQAAKMTPEGEKNMKRKDAFWKRLVHSGKS